MLSSNPPQATDVGSAVPVTLPLNLIAIEPFLLKDTDIAEHQATVLPIHPGNCTGRLEQSYASHCKLQGKRASESNQAVFTLLKKA
jgi:hypothetical protein